MLSIVFACRWAHKGSFQPCPAMPSHAGLPSAATTTAPPLLTQVNSLAAAEGHGAIRSDLHAAKPALVSRDGVRWCGS